MKYIYKIVFVLMLLVGVQEASAQVRDTIVIHDTVYVEKPRPKRKANIVKSANLIRIKPLGRYDRGIVNYELVPKGKWIGGLTFSYVSFDSDDSSLLYALLGDMNMNLSMKSIHPYVGYAVKDNMVIGAKFGYSHIVGDLGSLDLNLGSDLSFSLSNMRYSEDLYSFGVFHRSYLGLDTSGRFGLFNETVLTYRRGTSNYSSGTEEDGLKHTETTINELRLGINPGVVVFILPNVCAEMSFGVAGFKYRSEKQRNESGEEGSRRNSGANFKINLLDINIGITLCL